MVKDFSVKSGICDYQVHFVDDFTGAFKGKNGDEVFVIADKIVFDMVAGRII